MTSNDNYVRLTFPAQERFLPLVENSVTITSELLGLSPEKVLKLNLAIEEIFLHFVRILSGRDQELTIVIVKGSISVDVRIDLQSELLGFQAMNIVSSGSVKTMIDDEDFDQLGLLLASQFIDDFHIDLLPSGQVNLLLSQEMDYPDVSPDIFYAFPAKMPFTIEDCPDSTTLQQACIQALALYSDQEYSRNFLKPGRLADLVSAGKLAALVMKDSIGSICGLLLWEPAETQSTTFHGPYIFTNDHQDVAAEQLSQSFLSKVARSQAKITFTSQATNMLPMSQFENLGELQYNRPGHKEIVLKACYRHLKEDSGEAVWAHQSLVPFLEAEYQRLFLVRDIRAIEEYGHSKNDSSLFAVDLDHNMSLSIMEPMVDGKDLAKNIHLHVSTFVKQGIKNLICIIDLGVGWQGAIAGELLSQGFVARYVMPLAGVSDHVVFQYSEQPDLD